MSNPPATPATSNTNNDNHRMIMNYLTQRGYNRAVQQLQADIDDAASGGSSPASSNGGGAVVPGGKAVGLNDLAQRNAPSLARTPSAGGAGAGAPGNNNNAAAAAAGQMRKRPDQSVAGGQMLADPPSWEKGYEGLRTFVENSLDIHRAELHPILLPLFVHSYLDLVLVEYRDAADRFLDRFSSDHAASDPHIIRMLSSIRLPSHLSESEEATRWRQERYNVRMSERGWGLVSGWLQGGGLAGSIEGTEARGRDRVLAIINERVKLEKFAGPPAQTVTDYGLTSDFANKRQPNKGLDDLKLGPAPTDQKLLREVQRIIRDEDGPTSTGAGTSNGVPLEGTASSATVTTITDTQTSSDFESPSHPTASTSTSLLQPLISPGVAEILPYPSALRTIDVAREVEKVREARKRIKLGGEAFSSAASPANTVGGLPNPTGASKPSVCLFTVHDSGESLITASFSEDSTLLAAGFSESYIRLWNLKGEKMPGLRNDFSTSDVTDAASLKRMRQLNADAPTSRKLIGHSGPIYAVSFDPVPGPSAPPRYLLSCSQDTTIRLWSLETYTNLVAYRGHREPVWDVEWGPRGIYFASASRDRTARLWCTDKVTALRIFAGHLSDVNCVRFHPNSLYLATGSSDRTCRLWDVQKGSCVRVFVGHRGPVCAIAISPDGRYLASGSDDLTIILWDLASGSKVKTMRGHTSSIHSLSFSAESTVLVSGSSDSTVRVWDVLAIPEVDVDTSSAARKFAGADNMMVRRIAGGVGVQVGMGGKDEKKKGDKDGGESPDLLATLATKRTPVLEIKFTTRNLVLALGAMQEPEI